VISSLAAMGSCHACAAHGAAVNRDVDHTWSLMHLTQLCLGDCRYSAGLGLSDHYQELPIPVGLPLACADPLGKLIRWPGPKSCWTLRPSSPSLVPCQSA
jgi:hypothetical protein